MVNARVISAPIRVIFFVKIITTPASFWSTASYYFYWFISIYVNIIQFLFNIFPLDLMAHVVIKHISIILIGFKWWLGLYEIYFYGISFSLLKLTIWRHWYCSVFCWIEFWKIIFTVMIIMNILLIRVK